MKKKTIRIISAVLVLIIIAAGSAGIYYYSVIQKVKSDDPTVWESDIQAFEKSDKRSPIPAGSILFIGSSSIRFWDTLSEDMSPLTVINRGFGGAKIPDVIHYAPRIVFPYQPKIIVLYCGDNDMSMGRIHSADEVLNNYKKFVGMVNEQLPETRIYYISIKPSLTRWEYWPEMAKANGMIQHFSDGHEMLDFIDITSSMLDADGKPREDILISDGIHMNDEGYRIWTSIIKPVLEKD